MVIYIVLVYVRALTFACIRRLVHNLLNDLISMISDGSLPTIAPITQFPISEVESAMRFMAGGTHIGKIVISARPDAVVKV